jgi:hypothetical protein
MRENLDVFSMCPSVEPAGRRSASLDRVLRGEFPWFVGTIKALRLPAAHPSALRCLRVVVPPRSLVLFAPRRTRCPRFAVRVTHAPRKTRFQPLVRLYWTGMSPAAFR